MKVIDDIQTNKLIVSRLYRECLNEGRFEVVGEIISPDFVNRTFGQRGVEAFATTVKTLHACFENLHFEVEEMVAEEDRVAVMWTMRGRHVQQFFAAPGLGKVVEQTAIVLFRLSEGKITESTMMVSGFKPVEDEG